MQRIWVYLYSLAFDKMCQICPLFHVEGTSGNVWLLFLSPQEGPDETTHVHVATRLQHWGSFCLWWCCSCVWCVWYKTYYWRLRLPHKMPCVCTFELCIEAYCLSVLLISQRIHFWNDLTSPLLSIAHSSGIIPVALPHFKTYKHSQVPVLARG